MLHLLPLPSADAAALVRALVGEALAPDLVERVAEASGGNALFVEELLRTWVDTGVLTQDGAGEWTLAVDAQEVALPPTVQAIYAGQLDDLPPAARTAARRASVAGRRFPSSALETLEVADGAEALGTLVRRALVGGPHVDPTLGESYVYRHALLRDAGYASLARAERARLHLRLADWLASFPEETLPTLAEVIARHYAAALESAPALAPVRDDVRDTAATWFERASELAAQFAAWESARALAARAVELTEEGHSLQLARRLELVAEASANTVGVDEAKRLVFDALELYRQVDDGPERRRGLASAGALLGRLLRAQTRFEEAERLASDLLKELGAPEDAASARLLVLRSTALLNAWDAYDRADVDAVRALELAREAADEILELEALQLIVQIAGERGDDTRAQWSEIEVLARDTGQWETVAGAMRSRAASDLDDEPERALPQLAAAAEVAIAHGLIESTGWCEYARAEAQFAAGSWDAAIEAGLQAVDLGERHDFHRLVVRSWFVLLPLAQACGRVDLIRQAYPRFAARKGLEPDSHYARIVATAAHLHFAELGLEPAFVPGIEPRLESFDLDHAGPSWLAAVETVVGSWLDAGELAGVEETLDRMRSSLDSHSPTRLARAAEALLRARLHVVRGEVTAGASEAELALALLEARAPWWRSRAIRILEQAGAATTPMLKEAATIEQGLGI